MHDSQDASTSAALPDCADRAGRLYRELHAAAALLTGSQRLSKAALDLQERLPGLHLLRLPPVGHHLSQQGGPARLR